MRHIAVMPALLLGFLSMHAASFCQENSEIKTEAEKQYTLCVENVISNNFKDAIQHGEEAIRLDSKNSQYHCMLGHAYGLKAQLGSKLTAFGAAKKCRSLYEKAVALDSTNLEARSSLVSYYSMAPGIVGGGMDKAIAQAEAIAKIDPAQGHRSFAQIYSKEKEFDKAEQEYKKAIALSDSTSRIQSQIHLGQLYQQIEKFDLAAEQFKAAITQDSSWTGTAYYNLAQNSLLSEQEYLKGIEYADLFMDILKPNDTINRAWGLHVKGLLYEKLELKQKARAAYTAALELNPDCKPAEDALKKLK